MSPKPQSKLGRIAAQFLVGAVLIALLHVAASGQQNAKKKKSEIEKEKRAEALKKMAAARGDIEFNGRTIKQPQFKKMSKPATAEQLGNLKEKSPVVIVGMPIRKDGDNWIVATKKGASGWNAGLITVTGEFRGKFIDGELAAVYGEQTKIGNDWGLRAYLVDKPAGDDLGLVFQYKVLGQKAAAACSSHRKRSRNPRSALHQRLRRVARVSARKASARYHTLQRAPSRSPDVRSRKESRSVPTTLSSYEFGR